MTRLFRRFERASHVIGVFLTLAGLPAAFLGAYAFGWEILDRLTPPDVTLSVPRMTIRCFGRISSQTDLNRIREGDNALRAEICGGNDLSIGFLATLENQDSIPRTITDVTARLILPEGAVPGREGPLDMDLAWFAQAEIHGSVPTNVRRAFTHLDLPPQTVSRREISIGQSAPTAERISWEPVRNWLTERAEAGQVVRTEIFLRIAGEEAPVLAMTCDFELRASSLDTYRSFPVHGRRAFTAACLDMSTQES